MPSSARVMPAALDRIGHGRSVRLPQGFQLTKPNGNHAISAVCDVDHPDGWELRMVIDGHGLLRHYRGIGSQDAREGREGRAALLEKGWS